MDGFMTYYTPFVLPEKVTSQNVAPVVRFLILIGRNQREIREKIRKQWLDIDDLPPSGPVDTEGQREPIDGEPAQDTQTCCSNR